MRIVVLTYLGGIMIITFFIYTDQLPDFQKGKEVIVYEKPEDDCMKIEADINEVTFVESLAESDEDTLIVVKLRGLS